MTRIDFRTRIRDALIHGPMKKDELVAKISADMNGEATRAKTIKAVWDMKDYRYVIEEDGVLRLTERGEEIGVYGYICLLLRDGPMDYESLLHEVERIIPPFDAAQRWARRSRRM